MSKLVISSALRLSLFKVAQFFRNSVVSCALYRMLNFSDISLNNNFFYFFLCGTKEAKTEFFDCLQQKQDIPGLKNTSL